MDALTSIYNCTYIIVMLFEWDQQKNQANFAKHKINFELASKVFDDPLAKYQTRHFPRKEVL